MTTHSTISRGFRAAFQRVGCGHFGQRAGGQNAVGSHTGGATEFTKIWSVATSDAKDRVRETTAALVVA